MGPIRIANCSGFYGDRLAAPREMIDGGPIDVLTGDYLAELTMAILWRNRAKDPDTGYATTFLAQLEDVLADCVDRGIKIVASAGGLNPSGLATKIGELASTLGVGVTVGSVSGDDLMARLDELLERGIDLRHLDTGAAYAEAGVQALSANAYLGGWGIAAALDRGADVVVTGRVADAALVSGPAAWHFGWARDDWDALAGATVAGHIVECGAQCTGGNYSFFEDVPGLEHCGFPIAEISADGSSVITKHPGTGGLVSVGTVTAQLLYEVAAPPYLAPDVTAHFDSVHLAQDGPDRVRVEGVRGGPPPTTTKVGINYFGGYRNSMTLIVPGLDVEQKAEVAERALFEALGGKDRFDTAFVELVRSDKPNPATNDEAFAQLRIIVKDRDASKVGRAFSGKVVEQALDGYPGFTLTTPPGRETPYAVFWPALVPSQEIVTRVAVGGETVDVAATTGVDAPDVDPDAGSGGEQRDDEMIAVPFGRVFGARSGDKGGNANLGVWAESDEAYDWLEAYLTTGYLQRLLPEAREVPVDRYPLPNIRSINFVLRGFLGEGVAASVKSDPQAKTLGEYLRAKVVDLPRRLLTRPL